MNEKIQFNTNEIGYAVTVYDRYLFSVPVLGVITAVSQRDGAYQVSFYSDNPGKQNVTKHNGKYFHREQCRIQRPTESYADEVPKPIILPAELTPLIPGAIPENRKLKGIHPTGQSMPGGVIPVDGLKEALAQDSKSWSYCFKCNGRCKGHVDQSPPKPRTTLPVDSATRKDIPMFSGLLTYFPKALAEVAYISKIGNDKHNPGQPLHHSRGKSADHADCIMRHLIDMSEDFGGRGGKGFDENGVPQVAYIAWRALALAQEWCEKHLYGPLAPAARPQIAVPTPHLDAKVKEVGKDTGRGVGECSAG